MAALFTKCFKKLDDRNQRRIGAFLKFWKEVRGAEGVVIINNLFQEHFLSEEGMDNLLQLLLGILEKQPKLEGYRNKLIDRIEAQIKEGLYQSMQLGGSFIKCDPPSLVGLVIPRKRFEVEYLQLFNYSEQELRTFLSDISRYPSREWKKPLWIRNPEYLLWFTWCRMDSSNWPFCFAKEESKDEVIMLLGLDNESYKADKLYAFAFDHQLTHAGGGRLYRPTFCDAALCKSFRPTDGEIKYGLTNPIQPKSAQVRGSMTLNRQPEAIIKSRSVTLRNLKRHKILY